jgi:CheY-like chemotaxis protein
MKKILVIEDEPPVRANILELLEAEDFDGVGAANGFIGALWAQEHLPDLIICDVMMPEVNGYEVLSALRENPMTNSIPFIFLTAMSDKADIRQGMNLGADDYLTKPFTRAELLEAISSRLNKQESVMQQYNNEQQRTKALKQKVQELQQNLDVKDSMLKQFQQQSSTAVSKLNMAINMLKNMQSGTQRDRCLAILQKTCAEEIALTNQIPNLKSLMPTENFELLQQFNIVND